MSFMAPKAAAAPAIPPPPPPPPTLSTSSVALSGAAQRQAQAVADGSMGFDKTVATSPQGTPAPNTTAGSKALLGQ